MTQVNATYTLEIDLNRDRDFSDASEDISTYWKSLRWQLGAANPYDTLARTNTLECVLQNSDGRFSPEHASGLAGFELGALIRLRSTYSATTRQHFIGWITEIAPAPGSNGPRDTRVRAEGFFGRLFDALAFLPVQQGQTYAQIVTALLSAVAVYPPGFVGWLLGEFSLLGQSTYLGATSLYSSLEAGINTFNYAGDNWSRGISALSALRDLMNAERGFLYESRSGLIEGFNRHHFLNDMLNAVDLTLAETQLLRGGVSYKYGDYLANDVAVKFHPRTVGTSLETLGTLQHSFAVPAGQSAKTLLKFDDGSNNRIGGYGVVCLPNTDFRATSQREGLGADVTSNVSVTIVEGGSSCNLTFRNIGAQDAFITQGSRVRGYKITDFVEQEYRAVDETSVGLYGRQQLTHNLTMLDDPEYARNLCVDELAVHSTPLGQISGVTIQANVSDALMIAALARTMGDRVAVSESQTGLSGAEYHIVGERHTLPNRYNHRADWVFRPARTMDYWKLGEVGYSEIGNTTKLAF